MIVQMQQLHEDAVLPSYAHPGDAGMDLVSVEHARIAPGERMTVSIGIAIALPAGHVGLVWDKSGRAAKEGLTTLAGVIDEGYRGELKVVLYNTSSEERIVEAGQKVAQLVIQPVVQPAIEIVESLDDTDRGEGGFGSTGL